MFYNYNILESFMNTTSILLRFLSVAPLLYRWETARISCASASCACPKLSSSISRACKPGRSLRDLKHGSEVG